MKKLFIFTIISLNVWAKPPAQGKGRAPAQEHGSSQSSEAKSESCELSADLVYASQDKIANSIMALAVVDSGRFASIMNDFEKATHKYVSENGKIKDVRRLRSDLRFTQAFTAIFPMAIGYTAALAGSSTKKNKSRNRLISSGGVLASLAGVYSFRDADSTDRGDRTSLMDLLGVSNMTPKEAEAIIADTKFETELNDFCDELIDFFHIKEEKKVGLKTAIREEIKQSLKKGDPKSLDVITFLEKNGFISHETKVAALDISKRISGFRKNMDTEDPPVGNIKEFYNSDDLKASATELRILFEKIKAEKGSTMSAEKLKMLDDSLSELRSLEALCSK